MKRWIAIALPVLALAGCGGDSPDRLEAPAFDLTGRWVTTEIDCDSSSGDPSQLDLSEFDGDLEYEALQSPGVHIAQTGNDLEFTDLESGRRWDGAISGDQVRYVDSYQLDLDGLDFDADLEAEGTALDAGRIAATNDMEWTFTGEGATVSAVTLCTVRLGKEPDSAVPRDDDEQPPYTGTVVLNSADRPVADWGEDPYVLEQDGDHAPRLEGDVLSLTVSYAGGCRRHDFTLVADDHFKQSDPVKLSVFLAHDAHGDPCEAYPTERWEFDLTPIKRLYQEAYRTDEGVIALGIHGPVASRTAPGGGYLFGVTYTFE